MLQRMYSNGNLFCTLLVNISGRINLIIFSHSKKGSGYRTTCESSYWQPYSTATCNVTVTHDDSAVELVETY